jgi:hypothetical protein
VALKFVRQDGTMTREFRALVDSGCSRSTFPAELATELGIDLSKCEPIPGVTASGEDDPDDESSWQKCWTPGIDALFWGQKVHLHAYFRDAPIPILLGREDFFRYFKILFDERAQRFQLEAYA